MPSIDSGKNILVDHCNSLSINLLIRNLRRQIKEELIIKESVLLNQTVEVVKSKTGFNGLRYWFKCHKCKNKVEKIYVHPISRIIGCRKCLNLEYRSRRYKGMIENS